MLEEKRYRFNTYTLKLEELETAPTKPVRPVDQKPEKRLIFALTSICYSGLLVFFLSLSNMYLSDRIVWNTTIGDLEVGGLTISEARRELTAFIDNYNQQSVKVLEGDAEHNIKIAAFGIRADLEDALRSAYQTGHRLDFWRNLDERVMSIFQSNPVPMPISVKQASVSNAIIDGIPNLRENQAKDAEIIYENRQFKVSEHRDGLGFDADGVYSRLISHFEKFSVPAVAIEIFDKKAEVTTEIARAAIQHANRTTWRQLILTYTYDGFNIDRWTLYLRTIKSWYRFKKVRNDDSFDLLPTLDAEKLRAHLNKRIAKYMYIPKEDTRIEIKNGRPMVSGLAKDGYYLDIENSIKGINQVLMNNHRNEDGQYEVPLQVAYLEGRIENPDNELGISDLLATGVTDFFGSPSNRIFNIGHGAKNFQNVFIEPGKKFSFVRYMGDVDSTTGYLKELVIVNGDSSEPQYGGGMCQISSTLFRTAFFAGLHIVNRVNHSYEVQYYKPIGLDATVYDPYPDLIFKNDTPNKILIQNYVDKGRTKIYFKIFGRKDGRKTTWSGPVDYGVVGEDSTYYKVSWLRSIELPSGEKKVKEFFFGL